MGLASGRSEPNRSASVGEAVANLGHKIELTGTTSLGKWLLSLSAAETALSSYYMYKSHLVRD